MLVLSRKQYETLQIGNGITITILDITSGQVRIGIDAPKDVSIVRSELVQSVRTEKAINWMRRPRRSDWG